MRQWELIVHHLISCVLCLLKEYFLCCFCFCFVSPTLMLAEKDAWALSWAVVLQTLNPTQPGRQRGRWISVSLKAAWSTESSRTAKATKRNPVSERKQTKRLEFFEQLIMGKGIISVIKTKTVSSPNPVFMTCFHVLLTSFALVINIINLFGILLWSVCCFYQTLMVTIDAYYFFLYKLKVKTYLCINFDRREQSYFLKVCRWEKILWPCRSQKDFVYRKYTFMKQCCLLLKK